ncbi:hypothetical protein [Teredinibacter turnerae]|uniref:hypothetical protein n=1 Tax=Teredinibacter turnerae TaxID=2426 RepID=UPI0030CC0206
MKYLILALALFFSSSAFSELTWYNDLTIVSAGYYWDGSRDVWEVKWEGEITTGCAVSDSHNVAAWRHGGGADIFVIGNVRLATALSALSSGKKVDLQLNPSVCDAYSGADWGGIRVHN